MPCSQGGLKSCPLPANGFARRRGKDFSILLVKRNYNDVLILEAKDAIISVARGIIL